MGTARAEHGVGPRGGQPRRGRSRRDRGRERVTARLPRVEHVPAVEVLLNSPLIADLIFKGEVTEIKEVMKYLPQIGRAHV